MAMRFVSFIALLLTSCLLNAGDASHGIELVAFVGRPIAYEKIPCESHTETDPETGDEQVVICMDAVFRMTYLVEESIEGGLMAGSEVTFQAADHYGFPPFATQARALLYLGREGGRLYHMKYEWDQVYRTTSGEYARCGCNAQTGDDEPPAQLPRCQSYRFVPPVEVDLRHLSTHEREKYQSDPAMKVRGDTAECVRGIRSLDIVEARKSDLLDELRQWSSR